MKHSIPESPLVLAWRRHNEINLYLLEQIPEAGLEAVPLLKSGKPSRGRTVRRNFAHLHNARFEHMTGALRRYQDGVTLFAADAEPGRAELKNALCASSLAVERMIREAEQAGALHRKQPAAVFAAMLIAHESHHRGQMMLALKQSGVALAGTVKFEIWTRWLK